MVQRSPRPGSLGRARGRRLHLHTVPHRLLFQGGRELPPPTSWYSVRHSQSYVQYMCCAVTVWHQKWYVFRQQRKQRIWSATKERAVPSQKIQFHPGFMALQGPTFQHLSLSKLTLIIFDLDLGWSWSNIFHIMQFAARPGQHSPELDWQRTQCWNFKTSQQMGGSDRLWYLQLSWLPWRLFHLAQK